MSNDRDSFEKKIQLLRGALQKAVDLYGKPGGPWNVPSDPGGWLDEARNALNKVEADNSDTCEADNAYKIMPHAASDQIIVSIVPNNESGFTICQGTDTSKHTDTKELWDCLREAVVEQCYYCPSKTDDPLVKCKSYDCFVQRWKSVLRKTGE